jgi:hypothetical protein
MQSRGSRFSHQLFLLLILFQSSSLTAHASTPPPDPDEKSPTLRQLCERAQGKNRLLKPRNRDLQAWFHQLDFSQEQIEAFRKKAQAEARERGFAVLSPGRRTEGVLFVPADKSHVNEFLVGDAAAYIPSANPEPKPKGLLSKIKNAFTSSLMQAPEIVEILSIHNFRADQQTEARIRVQKEDRQAFYLTPDEIRSLRRPRSGKPYTFSRERCQFSRISELEYVNERKLGFREALDHGISLRDCGCHEHSILSKRILHPEHGRLDVIRMIPGDRVYLLDQIHGARYPFLIGEMMFARGGKIEIYLEPIAQDQDGKIFIEHRYRSISGSEIHDLWPIDEASKDYRDHFEDLTDWKDTRDYVRWTRNPRNQDASLIASGELTLPVQNWKSEETEGPEARGSEGSSGASELPGS